MTREETQKIVVMISMSFPNWSKPKGERLTQMIDMWAKIFEHDDYEAIQAGLMNYMRNDTTGFAPTPGQIRASIKNVAGDYDDTEDAVALVRKAIKNGNYGYVEEFNKLPLSVQKAVGSADNIRAWAAQPLDQFESITLSAVRKAYRNIKAQEANVKSVLPVTNAILKQSKDHLDQLYAEPTAMIEEQPAAPTVEVKEPEQILTDAEVDAIKEVWNSKPKRREIVGIMIKIPIRAKIARALIDKLGLESYLQTVNETEETDYGRFLEAICSH